MKYKKGDTVILRDDLEHYDELSCYYDKVSYIEFLKNIDRMQKILGFREGYYIIDGLRMSDSMVDHEKTAELNNKDLIESDNVKQPSHYTNGDIECIDAIRSALTEEEFRGHIKGVCLKYLWREKYKNGDEDLKKVMQYLEIYFNRK